MSKQFKNKKLISSAASANGRSKINLCKSQNWFLIEVIQDRQLKRHLLFTEDTYMTFFTKMLENTASMASNSPKIKQTKELKLIQKALNSKNSSEKLKDTKLREAVKYNQGCQLTSEDILQMIYQLFGEEKFLARDFREEYESMYNRSDGDVWLYRLKNRGRLNTHDVEVSDPRVENAYSLSKESLKEIRKYSSFTSKNHPRYWRKN